MSRHINTTWKLTSLGSELGMNRSGMDIYTQNYRNVREASFNFLVDWRQQITTDNEATWRQILSALLEAEVFTQEQLIEFSDTL